MFIACRSRSRLRIACWSWVRSNAQFEVWTSDGGQPDACGFVVQTSPAWLVATQPPCPLETVPGPQAGGGGGGHFCPLHGFGGRGRQFLPTHGLGAFASSGRRPLRANKRVNQLCGLVVGGCSLTSPGIGCWGFDFTFSELSGLLREEVEPSRPAWDAGLLELEYPLFEAWFDEPAEEGDPALECEAPDDPPAECADDPPEDPYE